jgi:TDG/mug DNA glycosylase family protein
MSPAPARPSAREALEAARGRTIPDVLGVDLCVLFCGINPSLLSGLTGHHYARPGNRFWPALHLAGFTDRRLRPEEDATLPRYGLGCTNLVARATARADELRRADFEAGGERLRRLVAEWRPRCVAIVGIGAARLAFDLPQATFGPQALVFGGAPLWVLPSTSGLNAHHQLPELVEAFGALHQAFGQAIGKS